MTHRLEALWLKSKRKPNEVALPRRKSTISSASRSELLDAAKSAAKNTGSKIQMGLARKTASTGTPIKDLSGGAKFMAQLSNIGGGSVDTGGGGIKDGLNTITKNVSANTVIEVAKPMQNRLPQQKKKTK